jgi:uncharacterized protein YdiU (UPF0061 family)
MLGFSTLKFDNQFARLGTKFSVRLDPDGLTNPEFVAWNDDLAQLLGFTDRPSVEEIEGFEEYRKAPPDWGKHLIISCSS